MSEYDNTVPSTRKCEGVTTKWMVTSDRVSVKFVARSATPYVSR